MTVPESLSLYLLPPVSRLDFPLVAKCSVLHVVNDDSYQQIVGFQRQFDAEQTGFNESIALTHVFVGGNPIPMTRWLEREKISAKVYWYGPDDSDCPVISNKSVSAFPYYLVYERETLVQAGDSFPPSFSLLLSSLEDRKLRVLAETATSIRHSDISSEVIISLLLQDIITELPLFKPPTPAQVASLPPDTSKVLEEQKQLIESLRQQIAVREKEVQDLWQFAATNPAFQAEFLKPKEAVLPLQAKPSVPVLPVEAGDFWNEEPDEDLAALPNRQLQDISSVKGLWILSAENEFKPTHALRNSVPLMSSWQQMPVTDSLPSTRSPKPGSFQATKSSSFFEQRQRHLEKLQEKQPLGRDGKRLPMPRLNRSDHQSTPNLKKPAAFRKNALAASETPSLTRNRLAYGRGRQVRTNA